MVEELSERFKTAGGRTDPDDGKGFGFGTGLILVDDFSVNVGVRRRSLLRAIFRHGPWLGSIFGLSMKLSYFLMKILDRMMQHIGVHFNLAGLAVEFARAGEGAAGWAWQGVPDRGCFAGSSF